jgi:tetratricopeptide (TPR) repeat protein
MGDNSSITTIQVNLLIRDLIIGIYFYVILLFSCNDNYVNKHNKNDDKTIVDLDYMANKFYKQKKYLEAKQLYDTLILSHSSNGQYFARRAYCNAVLGDFDAAKSDYFETLHLTYEDKSTIYLSVGMLYNTPVRIQARSLPKFRHWL